MTKTFLGFFLLVFLLLISNASTALTLVPVPVRPEVEPRFVPPESFVVLKVNIDRRQNTFCYTRRGHVLCYNGQQTLPVPSGLNNVASLVAFEFGGWDVGLTRVCANQISGAVICWDPRNGERVSSPRDLEPAIKLSTFSRSGLCSFKRDSTWACAKMERNALVMTTPIPERISNQRNGIVQIAKGAPQACALLGDGTAQCWLDESALGGAATWPTPRELPHFWKVSVGESGQNPFACGLGANGSMTCWGGDYQYADGNQRAGYPRTALIDFGRNVPSAVSQVATGQDHVCTLSTNGRVRCWHLYAVNLRRTGNVYERTVPDDIRNASQVRINDPYTACALLEGGDVRCWLLRHHD